MTEFLGNISFSRPYLMVALNSTSNYAVFYTQMAGTKAYTGVVIYHIHFDPDPANCGGKGVKSATTVYSHKMRYTDGGGSLMKEVIGKEHFRYFTVTPNVIYIAGYHSGFPSSSTAFTKLFTTVTAVRIEDIDTMQVHTPSAIAYFGAGTAINDLFNTKVATVLFFMNIG